jgi:hypothetical protein
MQKKFYFLIEWITPHDKFYSQLYCDAVNILAAMKFARPPRRP